MGEEYPKNPWKLYIIINRIRPTMARDGWGVWFWPVPSSLGNQTALLQLAATSNTPPPLFWEKGGPRYSLKGNNSIQVYNAISNLHVHLGTLIQTLQSVMYKDIYQWWSVWFKDHVHVGGSKNIMGNIIYTSLWVNTFIIAILSKDRKF